MATSYTSRYRHQRGRIRPIEQSFICIHCQMHVSCAPEVARVQNRNHCPYCLWSRHLDAHRAGDRLAGCRAAMEPIGLAVKFHRNKYASERDGELMLIHQCTICPKLALNRIAADDYPSLVLDLLAEDCALDAVLHARMTQSGIDPLTAADYHLVRRRLFGR